MEFTRLLPIACLLTVTLAGCSSEPTEYTLHYSNDDNDEWVSARLSFDDRTICRYDVGTGFTDGRIECPTGVAIDGEEHSFQVTIQAEDGTFDELTVPHTAAEVHFKYTPLGLRWYTNEDV